MNSFAVLVRPLVTQPVNVTFLSLPWTLHDWLTLCHCVCSSLYLNHASYPCQSLAWIPGKFYSFLSPVSSSLLNLWISLKLDAPFPEIFQENNYFMTAYIFVSSAFGFLDNTVFLPFPEPDQCLLPSQGLYILSPLHLDIISLHYFIHISTQIYCWRALSWFFCLIQKSLPLSPLLPFIFSSCYLPN